MGLSDIPISFLTDDQIYNELDTASAYCTQNLDTTTADVYMSKCYIVLASYYAYINYTTLAERREGTLPPAAKTRVDALRLKALSFLQPIALERLDENLVVDLDDQRLSRVAPMALLPTVVDYDE
jgi:hypothetical protein